MTEFWGVLLKPLDQQHDRDAMPIDPAGVKFDPTVSYPVWSGNNYRVPEDLLGTAKISRADDGSLVATGTLNVDRGAVEKGDIEKHWKLAISVIGDGFRRNGSQVISASRLISISMAAEHVDPDQPPIVIGTNIIRRVTVNIGRIGHYHVPTNEDDSGYCQKADVIKVFSDTLVNLDVTDGNGRHEPRTSVTVSAPAKDVATFHLATDCPWGR